VWPPGIGNEWSHGSKERVPLTLALAPTALVLADAQAPTILALSPLPLLHTDGRAPGNPCTSYPCASAYKESSRQSLHLHLRRWDSHKPPTSPTICPLRDCPPPVCREALLPVAPPDDASGAGLPPRAPCACRRRWTALPTPCTLNCCRPSCGCERCQDAVREQLDVAPSRRPPACRSGREPTICGAGEENDG